MRASAVGNCQKPEIGSDDGGRVADAGSEENQIQNFRASEAQGITHYCSGPRLLKLNPGLEVARPSDVMGGSPPREFCNECVACGLRLAIDACCLLRAAICCAWLIAANLPCFTQRAIITGIMGLYHTILIIFFHGFTGGLNKYTPVLNQA